MSKISKRMFYRLTATSITRPRQSVDIETAVATPISVTVMITCRIMDLGYLLKKPTSITLNNEKKILMIYEIVTVENVSCER